MTDEDKGCPICRLIEGMSEGKGVVCEDCKENQHLNAAYEGFKVLDSVRFTTILFVWGFPVMLTGFGILDMMHPRLDIPGLIVPWLIWVFNVFWLFPYVGLSRIPGKTCERMEKERQKMFVLKVRGAEPG